MSGLNTESSQIINYEITPSLTPTSDIVLLPFDIVNVYPVPGYGPQKNIKIEGEVLFPGSYTLGKKNESITEIIKRAGGLTKEAFPEGAVLIRATKSTEVDQIIKQKKLDAIVKQSSDTIKSKSLSDKESQLIPSIVGIDLAKILKNSSSKFDLFLEDNDIIRIPKTLQTVQVSGEVLYPVKMKYEKGKGFKKYVNESGGFSARSLKKRSYIIYANGTADATTRFLFMNFYPKVKPGAELIVPIKLENKKLSALEIASIATSLASLALILATVLKK
jgi:protein involved in polysaccharide export with SLBB domain